ncbi:MAG TPA: RimK-like protein [Xanthobacteraceae bacterium]|nr:RimK-like protein [Xanthobacteraceae bacterium]
MTPSVLVLAGLYDFASDLVCLRLKERGVEFLRLNREQLPEFRVTLDPLGPTLRVRNGECAWNVTTELRSVWYRQPVFLREIGCASEDVAAQLERSQWMAFIRALTVFQDAAWMNHPRETFQAETKPFQLALAYSVGFRIAPTLIGNDSLAFDALESPFAIKPLDTVLLRDGDDSLFAYTTRSDAADYIQSLRQAPVIGQRLLSPKIDIRMTVVGQAVYGVRILRNGKPIEGDWRKVPKAELQYEDWSPPSQISIACVNLNARLGLVFGGIDLIENEEGIFFIEVNPTGEWGWLNSATRSIDSAIAEWLASGGKGL